MSAALENVLGALGTLGIEPRQRGGGFMAQCPAHDDHSPSLSIGEGDAGRALVKCFKGCTTESIVAALGLTLGDLMGDAARRPHDAVRPMPKAFAPKAQAKPDRTFDTAADAVAAYRLGPHAAWWTYYDAAGLPVLVVVRWNNDDGSKKDIRPVGRWGNVWAQKIDTSKPSPLYLLADLGAADFVAVHEGEGKAEISKALGYVSTCSRGGAQAFKHTDWQPLAGKRVAIFPDNDEAGAQYADGVAKILGALTPPARVSIVKLPDLEKKEDIVDFVAKRGGVTAEVMDEIDRLIEEAEPIATPKTFDPVERARWDTERLVVVECLRTGGAFIEARGLGVNVECFGFPIFAGAWREIERIDDERGDYRPTDAIDVVARLRSVKRFDDAEIDALMGAAVVEGSTMADAVAALKRHAKRRAIADAVRTLDTDAHNPRTDDAQALFDERMERIAERFGVGEDFVDIDAVTLEVLEGATNKERAIRIETGLRWFDKMIGGGLERGTVTVIMARPSIGKTTLALDIVRAFARGCATYGGPWRGMFYTLEMTPAQLWASMLSAAASVNSGALLRAECTGEDVARIALATATGGTDTDENRRPLAGPNGLRDRIDIVDGIGHDIHHFRAYAKRAAQKGAKLIVLDYVQLFAGLSKSQEKAHEEIKRIMTALKTTAKTLDVCLVALSQVNREGAREDWPRLEQISEGDSIAHAASCVVSLGMPSPESRYVVVVKNRTHHPDGVTISFTGNYRRFGRVIAEGIPQISKRPTNARGANQSHEAF